MELRYSLNEIEDVAKQLLSNYQQARCFAFYAEMGSGKTTLIKALCKVLGVLDNVSSPTFSIMNEYRIEGNQQKVFHMDWYRLKNNYDAIEAGVQDVLEQSNVYCFIEWPEIAETLLPVECQKVYIHLIDEQHRSLIVI